MAISVIDRVWKQSTASGNGLLLMLAIADHANEHGKAWPGYRTLQAKCKIKNRGTITRQLKKLEVAGELIVEWRQGPNGTNWYQVCAGMDLETVDEWRETLGLSTRETLKKELETSQGVVQSCDHPENDEVVQSGQSGGSILNEVVQSGQAGGVTVTPKPLLTVINEPSINLFNGDFDFLKFQNAVVMQAGENRFTDIFKRCQPYQIVELKTLNRLLLKVETLEEVSILRSRFGQLCIQVLTGLFPLDQAWDVDFVCEALMQEAGV